MKANRKSGILLHPTSLPGPDGIGDLGPEAYRWLDFLQRSGTQMWQILPLGPTGYGDSPYQCFSAFAGNPFLINPLVKEFFLKDESKVEAYLEQHKANVKQILIGFLSAKPAEKNVSLN